MPYSYQTKISVCGAHVSQIELNIVSEGKSLVEANFFVFESSPDYPTAYLQEEGGADIWMIQECLDSVIADRYSYGRPILWLDFMQKNEGASINASSALKEALNSIEFKDALRRVGARNCEEILMHPYPIGVCDDKQAEALRPKMILNYENNLSAFMVSYPLMAIAI